MTTEANTLEAETLPHGQAALAGWAIYRQWAQRAGQAKTGGQRIKRVVLFLSIGAIILGPLSRYLDLLGAPAYLAAILTWVSVVVVALVAFFNNTVLGPASEATWVKARALAEKIKGETFRMIAGAGDYAQAAPGALLARVTDFVDRAQVGGVLPTLDAGASREKFPRLPFTIDGYLSGRVADQISYFAAQAPHAEKIAGRIRVWGWVLAGVVVALSVPAPFLNGHTADLWKKSIDVWTPVLTGVAAALAAQISEARYRFLADGYQAARSQLEMLRAIWMISGKSEAERNKLVTGCEDVLARENAAWFERLSRH